MVLALAVLAVSLVVGYLRGGSLDGLGRVPLRDRGLVVLAVVAQAGGALLGAGTYALGLAVSALLVAAFLVRNRGIRGTGLVALGLVANALVVGLNGAMPVSSEASGRAGVSLQDLVDGADPRHELSGPGTRLPLLGDVIPVLLPVWAEVVSPGDVLVAAGLAELVVVGMAGAPTAPPRRPPRTRVPRRLPTS